MGQNAAELAASSARYRETIDAVAQEQVWFDGGADDDPPGDCPLPATEPDVDTDGYASSLTGGCLALYEHFPDATLHVSSESYIDDLKLARESGLVVFTVDYAQDPGNVEFVLETSRDLGFVPFVGVRSLNEYVPPR